MQYKEQYTVKEIAEHIGKSEQTVRNCISELNIKKQGKPIQIEFDDANKILAAYGFAAIEKPQEPRAQMQERIIFAENDDDSKKDTNADQLAFDVLSRELAALHEQLKAKDIQIASLLEQNANLNQTVRDLVATNKALSASNAFNAAANAKGVLFAAPIDTAPSEASESVVDEVPQSPQKETPSDSNEPKGVWERFKAWWLG